MISDDDISRRIGQLEKVHGAEPVRTSELLSALRELRECRKALYKSLQTIDELNQAAIDAEYGPGHED